MLAESQIIIYRSNIYLNYSFSLIATSTERNIRDDKIISGALLCFWNYHSGLLLQLEYCAAAFGSIDMHWITKSIQQEASRLNSFDRLALHICDIHLQIPQLSSSSYDVWSWMDLDSQEDRFILWIQP